MRKFSFLSTLALMLFFSCSKDEGPNDPDDDDDTGRTAVSFSGDVQPIFSRSCVSCHNEFHLLNLQPCCSYDKLHQGYVDTDDPTNSVLYQKIKLPNPSMPPGNPLSEQEVATILRWIEEGAENN